MSYRDDMAKRAVFVRGMQCPKCQGALIASTHERGCWIPFHFRCEKCGCCWRDDGSQRGCRVGPGHANVRRIGPRATAT